ncbi:MAG: peptidylprolyl isomerase [Fibrobacterota bacterium]
MKKCGAMVSVFLFLFGIGTGLSAGDSIAAIVGDSVILKSEVEEVVQMEMQSLGAESDAMLQDITYDKVLEEMVDNMIISVHAERDTMISISEQNVNSTVNSQIQRILEENSITKQQLRNQLQQEYGMDFDDYRERLRSQIRSQMVMERIQQLYLQTDLTRTQVAEIYSEYADSLPSLGKSYRFQKIQIPLRADDAQRQEVYRSILSIREDIMSGDISFTAAAKEYSQGPNASRGGHFGFVSSGDLALQKLEREVFKYEPGEISPPIETRIGFHLVKVLTKRDNAREIQQIYLPLQKSEEDVRKKNFILDSVKTHAETAEDFTRAVHDFSEHRVSKAYDGYTSWYTQDELPGTLAEKIRESQPDIGTFIGPFEDDDALYLYRLSDYESDRTMTMEHDYSRIKSIAENIHARDAISELAKEWRREIFVKVY